MQAEIRQPEIAAGEAQKRLAAYLVEHDGISENVARRWAGSFLRSAHEQSGLFVESSPGMYTFLHGNFMEYFAATFLLRYQEDPLEVIQAHLDDEWWEQVLLLAAAHPITNEPFRRKLISTLLNCAGDCDPGSPAWERRLMLAGQLARDMGTLLPAPLRIAVEKALFAATTDPALPPPDRANLADTLDQFWRPADQYAYININHQPSPFYIAKYPVTNAQYERFLRPANFANPGLWIGFQQFSEPDKSGCVMRLNQCGEEGWKWLQGAILNTHNLVENGVLYPLHWRNARLGIIRPAAPVVGISWWEANASCQWLLAHWDELEEGQQGLPKPKRVRLPVEPEWVLAAGGVQPQDRYAWDAPDQTTTDMGEIICRANVDESQIYRTTPVWMYPLGASPDGVMDMCGNAWEWQANFQNQQEGWLGMRGGSWFLRKDDALVSIRSSDPPEYRSDLIGFRVVFLPE